MNRSSCSLSDSNTHVPPSCDPTPPSPHQTVTTLAEPEVSMVLKVSHLGTRGKGPKRYSEGENIFAIQ